MNLVVTELCSIYQVVQFMPSFTVFTESPIHIEFRLLGSDQYGPSFYVYQKHDDAKYWLWMSSIITSPKSLQLGQLCVFCVNLYCSQLCCFVNWIGIYVMYCITSKSSYITEYREEKSRSFILRLLEYKG